MSFNSFGHLLRFSSFGESHGQVIGGMLDGVPPNIDLSESDVQPFLDKRRPAQSRFTTQRKEPDKVKLLSGIYQGKTTGTPIAFIIGNQDSRSQDYTEIAKQYRPGHADYTYEAKYGIRDPRGGGRSSARETAIRVAAGAIARKILAEQFPMIQIVGGLMMMGEKKLSEPYDFKATSQNPLFMPCADEKTCHLWQDYLDRIRKDGDSVGAMVEIRALHVPPGWGAPIYGKLDADLASAMMSINAVKSVEIGDGIRVANMSGAKNADEMRMRGGHPVFLSNHAGGILGGISSGADIIVRFAVKPTSSILTPRRSIDNGGNEIDIVTKGRHDPCVGIRAVPVGEAMMALVLADHYLRHRGQCGELA
ncbi:MAG: chorismate synthase [Alphaproteobacteria bacterium]|nr:chorismate synthase [Alphaproteobacteria bacterium]